MELILYNCTYIHNICKPASIHNIVVWTLTTHVTVTTVQALIFMIFIQITIWKVIHVHFHEWLLPSVSFV